MPTNINGGVPGVNTPNKEAPRACDSEGLMTDTNTLNFRTDGALDQAPDGNAIANQIARLALAGHIVHKGDRGDYTVCKYGMTRYCADFAELAAFARQLGVK